jgi:NAD(P)H-dependent flavin oxidoreductase YrpB (nitropropane dioxygenase family)
MATQESPAHPRMKDWLVQAAERDTMLILRSLRNTERVLRNPVAEKVYEMEQRGATIEELAPLISGKEGQKLLDTGELDKGTMTAGQVVGLIRDIPTVKEVIDRIMQEAKEVVSHIGAEGTFEPVRTPSASRS